MRKEISNKRKLFDFLKTKYLVLNRTKAFRNRYKKYNQTLFEKNINSNLINEYKEKWSVFGEKVEVDTFLLSYNLSGRIDYNIVPENLFAAIIERRLNSYLELSFFSVKNVYEKWFENKEIFPKSYFHKIDGVFYDSEFEIIKDMHSFIKNSNFPYPLIIKPSKDTYGGNGVSKIKNREALLNKINNHDFIVCQEFIAQNEYLNKINNSSVNSIRSCLYRDVSGEFRILNHSIRFGVDGGLDNETAGGIVCNINNDGILNEYAVDKFANKFNQHPNSYVKFKDIQIPFYNELNQLVVEISNQVIFCNLISLDMVLDSDNNWRCLELNLRAQTIRFAQYAGKGFFDEYTDEVIERIKINSFK